MTDHANDLRGGAEFVVLSSGSLSAHRGVAPGDIASAALSGTVADYAHSAGPNLLDRWTPHNDWRRMRLDAGIDPYCRYTTSRIAPETEARDRSGRHFSGVNFASQEYLSLASHPEVVIAAKSTIDEYGVHSAGSSALMGLTEKTVELEAEIADFLSLDECTVFPTGWGAGYGVIKTLVKADDHIVIDVLAHACLREGAFSATKHVHVFPHLSNAAVERRLQRIRAENATSGILVVTESVFSMDSDVPDLVTLQAICHRYGASLLVDVAHDLGCVGDKGGGYMELQNMTGKVDIVMGSFSKSFASNGGFVASNHPALKLALRASCGPQTFSNSMSPVQASVVLACLKIIRSDEGQTRRGQLMSNIVHMRNELKKVGFELLGQPSPIIPIVLGDSAVSRLATRFALEGGALINLVEYPAVSRNSSRWRCQMMADHRAEHIDRFVGIALASSQRAREPESQRAREPESQRNNQIISIPKKNSNFISANNNERTLPFLSPLTDIGASCRSPGARLCSK